MRIIQYNSSKVIRKYNHSHSQLIHQSTIPSYQAILRDESDSIHHLSICCLYLITINEYMNIYVHIYICVHSCAYQRIALRLHAVLRADKMKVRFVLLLLQTNPELYLLKTTNHNIYILHADAVQLS